MVHQQLNSVGNGCCKSCTWHTDGFDQCIIHPHIQEGGTDGNRCHHFGLLVVILVVYREGTQEIDVVAGHKQRDNGSTAPIILRGIDMVYLRRKQHEAAGQDGEQLQKIPGFGHHGIPLALLHFLEEEGTPGSVQCTENNKQEIKKQGW